LNLPKDQSGFAFITILSLVIASAVEQILDRSFVENASFTVIESVQESGFGDFPCVG
jgi:hypothetical protein